MRTLLENLREDERAPVLKDIKWAGRYVVNDIGQAVAEIVFLRGQLQAANETIAGLRRDTNGAPLSFHSLGEIVARRR